MAATHPSAALATHLDYIDALRGLAILGVMLMHGVYYCAPLPGTISGLLVMGGRGVSLFYVVSALTLLRSHQLRREENSRAFFIRRFFRIAPLFYLACLFYLFWHGAGPRGFAPHGVGHVTVLSTVFFVNGWIPDAINALVPGGWSIAVEMTFYVFLPFFLRVAPTAGRMVGLFAAFMFLHAITVQLQPWIWQRLDGPAQFPGDEGGTYFTLWPIAQLPVFGIGLLVGFILAGNVSRPAFACGGLLLGTVLALNGIRSIPQSLVPAIGFGCLAGALAQRPFGLLVNRFTCGWGRISYSTYLLHLAVFDATAHFLGLGQVVTTAYFHQHLPAWHVAGQTWSAPLQYLVLLGVGLPTTFLVASLTFRWVEVPGQNLGRRVIARWVPPSSRGHSRPMAVADPGRSA